MKPLVTLGALDGPDGYGGTTAGQVRRNWAASPSISHVVLAEPGR